MKTKAIALCLTLLLVEVVSSSPAWALKRRAGPTYHAKFVTALTPFYILSNTVSKDQAKGGTFTYQSRIYAGLGGEFSYQLSPTFTAYSLIKIAYIDGAPITSSTKTLTQDTTILSTFQVGAAARLFFENLFKLYFGLNQEIFIYSPNNTQITQQGLYIPTIGLSAGWDTIHFPDFGIRLSALGEIKLGTTTDLFTVQAGFVYGGELTLITYAGSRENVTITIGTRVRPQNTSAADQTETSYYLSGRIPI